MSGDETLRENLDSTGSSALQVDVSGELRAELSGDEGQDTIYLDASCDGSEKKCKRHEGLECAAVSVSNEYLCVFIYLRLLHFFP